MRGDSLKRGLVVTTLTKCLNYMGLSGVRRGCLAVGFYEASCIEHIGSC